MSKTLSNGTLSLRFMQNAQRAKQQAQVEAEQAKVKDEAEWEVSQEVKDAWGLGNGSGSSPSSSVEEVIHETSYLPFIFSPDSRINQSDEAKEICENPLAFKGRRTFNKGKEVSIEFVKYETTPSDGSSMQAELLDGTTTSSRRPVSISNSQSPHVTKQRDSKRTKTAQMLVREDPILPPSSLLAQTPSLASSRASSTGFLKPSGVDDPKPVADTSHNLANVESNISPKRSRERVAAVDGETKKKRKKAKHSSS